jgi:aspartyl-tRNA(Asn)/glutamyl-tRNA(Gln) amidotransferase subunit C
MKSIKNNLSKKEIKHLSWLAKIKLTKEEEDLFSKQLNDILSYFQKIDEANVEDLSPTYHVVDITNVFRLDKPKKPNPEQILKNVPKLKGKYVKAPRIT